MEEEAATANRIWIAAITIRKEALAAMQVEEAEEAIITTAPITEVPIHAIHSQE